MRSIFTLLLATIACSSFSQTVVTAKPGIGEWDKTETWDVSQTPTNGTVVVIPSTSTVVVKGNIYNSLPTKPNLTIRIDGTLRFEPSGVLDLGATSTVQLTSGTSQITSQNTSNSQLMIIGGVTKYNASLDPTLTGPAFASISTGISPGGFTVGVLPIKLQSFTAQAQNNRVVLKWTTSEEINNSHYEVEKSTNARQWALIQRVAAEGQPADYTYSDAATASSEVYYRLKSVDRDGKSEYSHIVKVVRSRSLAAYVSPNPARTQVTVSLSTASTAPLQLQLVANNGQVVREGFFAKGSSLIQLGLQGTRAGIYTLVLREGSSVIEASQLLIQ